MVKIELTPEQADALVRYGKCLFEFGYNTDEVYCNMDKYGRDNFGFWMSLEQINFVYNRAVYEYNTRTLQW